MWKRGGRSTALERAEALLMTRKRPTNTNPAVKSTSVPPKGLSSDLNEPSVTSDSDVAVGVLGSTGTEERLEGGRSRFLKNAPTSKTFNTPKHRNTPEHRYLSSALSRLAQTKNHIPRSQPSRHDLGMSAAGTQSAEATVLSVQFSPEQSLNRRPFLKSTAAGCAVTTVPQRSQSGATSPSDDASVPVVGVTQSTRAVGGVSLESDDEDMKRLLDESVASTHCTRPGTTAPGGATQKSLLSTSRQGQPSSPQHSLSSTSSQQGAPSLEELCPVDRQSNDSCSEMSSASSEDFKMNVMGLDDLGFTEETKEKKLCGSPDVGPSDGLKEEEEVLNYHSDFDPVTWTESSTSQISEHILGECEEEELGSEVREKTTGSRLSCQKTEDAPTGSVSDTSPNRSLRTSDHSQSTKAFGATQQRGFTEPHGGACTCGRSLKDPGLEDIFNGVPQYVHAFSPSHPSTIVLIEMLRQQLAVTRQFVDRSRHLHSSLVQSLEPPNYKYTSLEDTKMVMRTHTADRPSPSASPERGGEL